MTNQHLNLCLKLCISIILTASITELFILTYVVNSIGLVKPEKAKMMEGMLIQMARTGQIAGKVHCN